MEIFLFGWFGRFFFLGDRFFLLVIQGFEKAMEVNAIHPGHIADLQNTHFKRSHGAAQTRQAELGKDFFAIGFFQDIAQKTLFRNDICHEISSSFNLIEEILFNTMQRN